MQVFSDRHDGRGIPIVTVPGRKGLLTVALLANLYVADIEADKHTVLLILRGLVLVVAQGPIQPQSEPVPFPAAKDRACAIFQTRQAG